MTSPPFGGRILALVCLSVLTLSSAVEAQPARELQQRMLAEGQAANALSRANFADMEQLAADFRDGRRRTESGAWLYNSVFFNFTSFSEANFLARERILKQWIAEKPRSSAAHAAYATLLYNHAWLMRGDGYAHQVTEAGREGFVAFLEKSQDVLEDAREFSQDDPQWHLMMLRVARSQGWPRPDYYALLKAAIERHPLYTEIYFEASEYAKPKWGGSKMEAEELFSLAVEATRKTEMQSYYARMFLDRRNDLHSGSNVMDYLPQHWTRLKEAFNDLVQRYPTAWNRNGYASFACMAGDKETAREQFSAVGEEITREIWSRAVSPDACRRWATP